MPSVSHAAVPRPAAEWTSRLERLSAADRAALAAIYGPDDDLIATRVALMLKIVRNFVKRHGDMPMRLFRAPGRINLRGMHVDTHGGFLNLMTHQRETVVAAAPVTDHSIRVGNLATAHPEVFFRTGELTSHRAFRGPWREFVTHPDVAYQVKAKPGHWDNYVRGSALAVQHRFEDGAVRGVWAVVGSDLPQGAGLSASSSLVTSLAHAWLGCNGLSLDAGETLLAARDAEWYAGARTGLSDPAAICLGGLNTVVSGPIGPDRVEEERLTHIPFPDDLDIVMVDSFTKRSLSGKEGIAYAQNRFAYSVALEIFEHELKEAGLASDVLVHPLRLADLREAAMVEATNGMSVYELLRHIPLEMTLDEMKTRCPGPELEEAFDRYFGTLPASLQPTTFAVRGPLMYGMAESERGYVFAEALQAGEFEKAGTAMTIGHDGDRVLGRGGSSWVVNVSDEALLDFEEKKVPLWQCAGSYRASTGALDALVDGALDAGALGASLTGAGMGGEIVALCRKSDTEFICDRMAAFLGSMEFARFLKLARPMAEDEARAGVIVNRAGAGAGEIVLP